MTGILAVLGSALIRRVASHPSITGSDKSIRTRSGRSAAALATPAAPSSAVTTAKSSSRICISRSRLNSTSSTMRIFFTASPPQLPCGNPVRQRHAYNLGGRQAEGGCARFAPSSRPSRLPSPGTLTGGRRFRCFAHRQRPPELLDQRLAVESPFLDKAKHTLLQHPAIGGGQGLGGEHDDRDFLVSRVALERVEEGKTVHARHD